MRCSMRPLTLVSTLRRVQRCAGRSSRARSCRSKVHRGLRHSALNNPILIPAADAEVHRLRGALRAALRLVDVLHVQASRVLPLTQAHLAGLAGAPH